MEQLISNLYKPNTRQQRIARVAVFASEWRSFSIGAYKTRSSKPTLCKWILALTLLILMSAATLTGCVGSTQSSPQEIDVIGMSVSDACKKLSSEGWSVDITDETPYSDYSAGGTKSLTLPMSESQYVGEETVVRVEYDTTSRSSASNKCHIYFESNQQSSLEQHYGHMLLAWQDWYDDLSSGLADGENPESVAQFAFERYKEMRDYEKERIPISKKKAHQELLNNFISMLNGCGYEIPETEIENDTSAGNGKNDIPADAISWTEAAQHIGETVTVYGPVVGAEYASTSNGQPTFIDIGADYPDKNRVTVTIWGESRDAFSPSPEAMYEGQTICVTGEIYLYQDVCNIEVTSPTQVSVL